MRGRESPGMWRSGVLEDPILELDQAEEQKAERDVRNDRLLEGERLVEPEARDHVDHLAVNPINEERAHSKIAERSPAVEERFPQVPNWYRRDKNAEPHEKERGRPGPKGRARVDRRKVGRQVTGHGDERDGDCQLMQRV